MENNLDVAAMFSKHHDLVRENLAKAFGSDLNKSEEPAYTEEQLNIIKGLSSDNPFERIAAQDALEKSDMTDIEKSDIMEAISYDNEFRIKKTGKEIKEQINSVLLPAKNAALEAEKRKADDLLADCGDAPTYDRESWYYGIDVDCGYKRYAWDETYIKEDCHGDICDSLSFEHQESKPKKNYPKTKDEAAARNDYNRSVDIICRILIDIKACDILLKNLKDNDEIKMTARQLVLFGMC